MSALSNGPYLESLTYWFSKLEGRPERGRFLATKIVEMMAFHSAKPSYQGARSVPRSFPDPIPNAVSRRPVVAVVVPAYLRQREDHGQLLRLVAALNGQTVKPGHIIVVDDGSPSPVPEISDVLVHRLANNEGPAAARNHGKRLARERDAEIIAFTDVDCVPDVCWIEAMARTFRADRRFNLLSGFTRSLGCGWLDLYHDINGTLNGRRLTTQGSLLYGTTANLAMTGDVASALDFNTAFPDAAGEDIEFCLRASRMGFAVDHAPEMVVRHDYGYDTALLRRWYRFVQQFRKYASGEKVLVAQVPDYYEYLEHSEEIPSVTLGNR